MDGDRPRVAVNRNCHRLSRVLWVSAQISCFTLTWCFGCIWSLFRWKLVHTRWLPFLVSWGVMFPQCPLWQGQWLINIWVS